MAYVQKRRLGFASALTSMLETDGGLTSAIVHTGASRIRRGENLTDEEANPEAYISKGTIDTSVQDTIIYSPEMLKSLASCDEIEDVMSRIVSYIAICPDLGSSFAYVDLLPGTQLSVNDTERTIGDMQRHWQIAQDLMFVGAPSLSIGIHKLIGNWLTFGILYFAIIRKKQFGEVIDIHIQYEPLKECKDRDNNLYWLTDFEQFVWEKEDIFVLDYKDLSNTAFSFVASIMRSYNMFRTVERTRVANAVMAAQFRSIYTVPTAGLGKVKARQKLSSVMSLYKRDIRINDQTGETTVNGENTYPVNTELWVAETSNGSVKIENPGDGNPNLNNTDLVDYFARKFYKRAKLPMSKYEAVDAGYLNGIGQLDEDDRQFALYIQDCRSVIAKCFLAIVWRLMSVLKDYAGRDALQKAMTMVWHDEPKHDTPSEAMDTLGDIVDKINGLLDKYKDMLTNANFSERQIAARLNVLRVKLMRKYAPELLEQNAEDYSNVPEEESPEASTDDWSSGGSDWDSGSDSDTDDFGDWDNSDWDDEFSGDDTNGDDWSEADTEDFNDFDW